MTEAKKLKRAPDRFWPWLAGFVDGDGSIVFDRRRRNYACLSFTQKDPTPLRHIRDMVGCGSLFFCKTHPYWFLRFGSRATRAICAKIKPFLILPDKISKAEEAIAWTPASVRIHDFSKKKHFQEVVDEYVSGASALMISEKFGVPITTVHYWLKKAGVRRSLSEAQRLRRKRKR